MRFSFTTSISRGPDELSDHCAEVLNFFEVPNWRSMSFKKAEKLVVEIMSDASNREKFERRHIGKEQKEILRYFAVRVAHNLSRKSAQDTIDELFENVANVDSWRSYEALHKGEKERLSSARKLLNQSSNDFDSQKIGMKRFINTVRTLEAEGHTVDQIVNDAALFFGQALSLHPDLATVSSSQSPAAVSNTKQSEQVVKSSSVMRKVAIILLVISIVMVYLFVYDGFSGTI